MTGRDTIIRDSLPVDWIKKPEVMRAIQLCNLVTGYDVADDKLYVFWQGPDVQSLGPVRRCRSVR